MFEHEGVLHITDVPNPRVQDKNVLNAVGFEATFGSASQTPVQFRMSLPLGSDYVANLTWDEWQATIAWFEWHHSANIAGISH